MGNNSDGSWPLKCYHLAAVVWKYINDIHIGPGLIISPFEYSFTLHIRYCLSQQYGHDRLIV